MTRAFVVLNRPFPRLQGMLPVSVTSSRKCFFFRIRQKDTVWEIKTVFQLGIILEPLVFKVISVEESVLRCMTPNVADMVL